MNVKVFAFPADLGVEGIQTLKQRLSELMNNEPNLQLQLDLGDVAYMDSAGLGVLVYAYNRARELGGQVTIHRPQPRVREVFRMSRMDQVFNIVDTPPAGVAGK